MQQTLRVERLFFTRNSAGELRVQWLGHGTTMKSDPEPRKLRDAERTTLALALLEGRRWKDS